MRLRALPVLIGIFVAWTADARAQQPELTLEQALMSARAMQPSLRMAEANRDAAQARMRQSRAAWLPQVSVSAQAQRLTSNYVRRPGSLPNALATNLQRQTNESFNFFVGQASLTQLIYDFGATSGALLAARDQARAQEHNIRTSLLSIDFSVRQAFLQAFADQALETVACETLRNARKHLRQIQSAVESGTQADIDVVTARSTVANAELNLLTVRNQLLSGKVALNQAMGLEAGVEYALATPAIESIVALESEAERLESVDSSEASALLKWAEPWVRVALEARPEVAQLLAQSRSLAQQEKSLRGQHLPSLGLQASITEQGGRLDELSYNWSAMGVINLSAFSGGRVHAQVQEAAANRRAMAASMRNLTLSIRAAVHNACLGLAAGKKGRDAAMLAEQSAKERLRLAEGRYQAGVGNILELSDAQLAGASASSEVVQAEYRWWLSRATLLYALGRSS